MTNPTEREWVPLQREDQSAARLEGCWRAEAVG